MKTSTERIKPDFYFTDLSKKQRKGKSYEEIKELRANRYNKIKNR